MPLNQTDQEYYENQDNWGNFQFIRLEDLVNNFLLIYTGNDSLLGNVERDKVIRHVKQGIREFTFSMLNQAKVVELELNDNYDIILPFDFVNYIRISWVDKSSGKIHPMSVNRSTPLGISHLQANDAQILFDNNGEILEGTTMIEAINESLPNVPIEQSVPYSIYPNVGYGTRYDIEQIWNLDTTVNYNGTFNINNTRIHFSTDNKERIILLEYVSDGLAGKEEEIGVHKFCETALYEYVNYNLCKNSMKIPNYEKANVKKAYDTSYRNARLKMLNIKPNELIQALKQNKMWLR
jgi:hypothetical protein